MRAMLAMTSTFVVALGCSNNPNNGDGGTDGGANDGNTQPTCDAGSTPGMLAAFTKPTDPGPGGILFSCSGEVLALTGYPFPPVNSGDPVFVDGWDVKFTRLLVTVDRIKMWTNPDKTPGDQSQTGALVAEVLDGPFAIDLS